MRIGWRVVVTALVAVVAAGAAIAIGTISEAVLEDGAFVIDRFDQQVVVDAAGDTRVQERIAVTFSESRRGIFRDLDASTAVDGPNTFRDIEVGGEDRDQPWNFRVEDGPTGPRVRIGDADVFLEPGSYVYGLRYSAPQWYYALASDPSIVELRIDVPGFDWPTSVEAGSLDVVVPAPVRDALCVEGPRQGTTPCATDPQLDGDTVRFTLGSYGVQESATVSVFFDRDAIDGEVETLDATLLTEDRPWYLGGFGPWELSRTGAAALLFLLLVLPIAAWEVVSSRRLYRDRVTDRLLHDRQHPTALPAPPRGMRPPELAGLLLRKDADDLFLSALVDLDQRGAIRTFTDVVPGEKRKDDTETLTVTAAAVQPGTTPKDAALVEALVPRGVDTTFDGTYDSSVAARVTAVQARLKERADDVFVDQGLVHDDAGLIGSTWFKVVAAAAYLVIAAALVGIMATATPLEVVAGFLVLAVVLVAWVLAVLPWRHHRLPLNSEGRDLIAQARAFEEFVASVEGEQLEWAAGQPGIDHHHPAVSLLPYAIAFGLADSWFARFGGVMEELAARDPATTGNAGVGAAGVAWWASTNSFSNVRTSQTGTSTAPSSSGGGGGGGGSGGGGGGGGSW